MPCADSDTARIETVGLGRTYPGVVALSEVNLWVGAATVLAVLGHNGAGKSTLIDILATRRRPTSGSATVCATPCSSTHMRQSWQRPD